MLFRSVGIDEDTALYIENGTVASVMGMGTVTVLDGVGVAYSSYADGHAGKPISIFGLTMHVLTDGDGFDFATRTPIRNGDIGEEIAIPAEDVVQGKSAKYARFQGLTTGLAGPASS